MLNKMAQRHTSVVDESSPARISACNSAFYQTEPEQPYVVLFTLNPVEQVPIWLAALADWFQKYGISLVYRHPLQPLPVEFFKQSLGTLLWSGSVPQFEPLKHFMRSHGLKFSFVECGFFPQTRHLYFDRQGINVDSSLAANDLRWLSRADIVRQIRIVLSVKRLWHQHPHILANAVSRMVTEQCFSGR